MGFKLPEIQENKPLVIKLGGHDLQFRKYKVKDFAILSSDPIFKKVSGVQEQMIVYIIAFLLDVEDPETDTIEKRYRFIESLELSSMYELFEVARVLGVDDSLIQSVQKKMVKSKKQPLKDSTSPISLKKQDGQ